MTPRIQIRHEAANGRTRATILAEFDRLNEKFDMTSADCVVDCEGPAGYVKTFEVNVHVPNELITVKESSDEVHKSIYAAFDILEKRLQKYKETYLRPGNLIRHNVNSGRQANP
jgi:ribosome-associated translation inhibitor RaiA